MGKAVVLSPSTIACFKPVASVSPKANALQDSCVRGVEDRSYSTIVFHPLYRDLFLAVREHHLEFYNAATHSLIPWVNPELLQRFRVDKATFFPGSISLERNHVEVSGDEVIVLFSNAIPGDNSVYAFSLASQRIVARFNGHEAPIVYIACSPSPKTRGFITASSDGIVLLWMPGDSRYKQIVANSKLCFNSANFCPVGAYDEAGIVMVMGTSQELKLFGTENPKAPFKEIKLTNIIPTVLGPLSDPAIIDFAISPVNCSRYIAVRLNSGIVLVVDSIDTLKAVALVTDAVVKTIGKDGMSFSLDGSCLIIPCAKPYVVFVESLPLVPSKYTEIISLKPVPLCHEHIEGERQIAKFVPSLACCVIAGDRLQFFEYKEGGDEIKKSGVGGGNIGDDRKTT